MATMTKQEQEQAERREARDRLREILPPGTEVLCILEHVTSSGMGRWIKLYAIHEGELRYLSGYVAAAGIAPRRNRGGRWSDGNYVAGCGMDMGFSLVYDLGRVLYPDGFDDGRESPRDGGYALRARWL